MAMASQGTETNASVEKCRLNIGQNVYVVAKEWQGKTLIHVREYNNGSDGKVYPTRNGIALQLRQWIELQSKRTVVDETIQHLKEEKDVKLCGHLGANVYVSVSKTFAGVDLRKCWWCDESSETKQSKKGIFLCLHQWEELKWDLDVIVDFVPEDTMPCDMQEDHQNQLGFLACAFCNPNGYHFWQSY